jgi:hypothetical protein
MAGSIGANSCADLKVTANDGAVRLDRHIDIRSPTSKTRPSTGNVTIPAKSDAPVRQAQDIAVTLRRKLF